jgi:hypothetical protein
MREGDGGGGVAAPYLTYDAIKRQVFLPVFSSTLLLQFWGPRGPVNGKNRFQRACTVVHSTGKRWA